MKNKTAVIAAALAVVAALMVIIAGTTIAGNREKENVPKETQSTSHTTRAYKSRLTTASDEDGEETTPEETEAPETTPEMTAEENAETAAVTTAPEVTTAPQTTEVTTATEATTTVITTTAATTTTVATTTTAATTTKAAELGTLGYNLSEKISTDKSLAGGDITKLIINEICAKNKASLKDSDGDFSDWVEIYNPTDKAVNLEGAGLSDSADEPLKWVFPSVNIQPKSYLVVFCSDKNTQSPQLHTNFKISGGNEEIILSDKSGKKIDSVIVPASGDDETYGRYPNASSALMILSATPGVSNDGTKSSREAELIAPIFSRESGFYEKAFKLSMTAEAGTTIYYTTDGSVPTTKSDKYTESISVNTTRKDVLMYIKGQTVDQSSEQTPRGGFDKCVVVRAIAVDSKGKSSPVSTATYFIGSSVAEKYKNVTVISVVSDPDDLFDNKKGIFVAGDVFTEWRKKNPTAALDGSSQGNFNQRGREWERDANVTLFRDGELQFSYDIGMRTHGGWSRNSQQKSMKFYFRADYGEKKLKYELFENNKAYDDNKTIKEYKRFMVRNGGNDSFCLLYKDPWTQACVANFPFATQASDVAVVFLDGEYWGLYTMNEVYDNNYVEENYGVDADDVIMIKTGSLEEGNDGDEKYWNDAVNFVKNNDMSIADNYKKACEYFDIDSFAEYIAFELYIGNEDWIWNNWAAWRSRSVGSGYGDGKWRFMVYDTEYAMDLYSYGKNYRYDISTQLANGDGHLGPIFKSLLKSSQFRSRMVLAFEDVMNIAFNPKSAASLLDSYHKAYSPYIPDHFNRYVLWQSLQGIENNRNSWKDWLKNRYDYMPQQISSVLSLKTSKTNDLTIEREGSGTVKINSIPITFTSRKWTGHYFSGYKITIEATPASGYEFAGWSGDVSETSAKITVDPSSALNITATFKKK